MHTVKTTTTTTTWLCCSHLKRPYTAAEQIGIETSLADEKECQMMTDKRLEQALNTVQNQQRKQSDHKADFLNLHSLYLQHTPMSMCI